MIVHVMKPYLFVLILPLIRALIQYLATGEINGLLALEIVAVAFILTAAILGWRSIKITVDDNCVVVKKGFLIKSYAKIEKSRLSSISLKQNILDFLFGSVNCSINTEAGRPRKSDFDIKMSISDAKRLYNLVYSTKNMQTIKFSAYRIAILAATTSSAVTGIVVGVPVINEISKLIGIAISDILLYEINVVSSKFNNVFPPIVNMVTIIILSAYGASFIISFLKNVNFKLKSDKENIEIQSGLVVRKKIMFKKSTVNNVCFEQTPFMRMLKKHSMRVSIGGYGDGKGEKAVIVPVAKHKELEKQLKKHFPLFKINRNPITPTKSAISLGRFFFLPIILAMVDVSIGFLLVVLFPYFDRVVMLLTLVFLCVILYYGSVCYNDYKYGRLFIDKYISASGSEKLTTRELYCKKTQVGLIKIYQTPADRRFKTCKVKITVRSENADSIRVKNLDLKTTADLIGSAYNLNIDE